MINLSEMTQVINKVVEKNMGEKRSGLRHRIKL